MSPITTHILDTAKGCPAAEIPVSLEFLNENKQWQTIAKDKTDADGRIMNWEMPQIQPGLYRIHFNIDAYHQGEGFFPTVSIDFRIKQVDEHYHVPLLLSPFSFSTYRGS